MSTFLELARDSIYSAILHLAPRFANVVLFILIGRLAGPAEAGVFSLAVTYLLIATTVLRGIDDLVIRQVSREPERAQAFLSNFVLLRLVLSLLLYAMLFFAVTEVLKYPTATAGPILVLNLSLIPDSLTYASQSVVLGLRQFRAPTLVAAGTTLIKITAGGAVALAGGSLIQVAWVWLTGSLIGMLVLLGSALYQAKTPGRSGWLDFSPLRQYGPVALPFLAITVLTTLEGQSDTVLLSVLRDETEVGFFNAATTIVFGLSLLSQAYRMSVYPLMARLAQQSPERLQRLHEQSLRYLGMLVLPMAAGIALLAPQIVMLLYKEKFTPTIAVVRWLIPVLVFLFLNVPHARLMIVHDRQRWVTLFLLASAATNIGLNLWLDARWGATGAAVARLVSTTLYFLLVYLYVERHLARAGLVRLLAKPAAATAVMSGAVWLVRDLPLAVPVLTGLLVYGGVLWGIGGIRPADLALLRQALRRAPKPAAPVPPG